MKNDEQKFIELIEAILEKNDLAWKKVYSPSTATTYELVIGDARIITYCNNYFYADDDWRPCYVASVYSKNGNSTTFGYYEHENRGNPIAKDLCEFAKNTYAKNCEKEIVSVIDNSIKELKKSSFIKAFNEAGTGS